MSRWREALEGGIANVLGVGIPPSIDYQGGGIVPPASVQQFSERTNNAQPAESQTTVDNGMSSKQIAMYGGLAVAGLVALVIVAKAVR